MTYDIYDTAEDEDGALLVELVVFRDVIYHIYIMLASVVYTLMYMYKYIHHASYIVHVACSM